LGSYIILLFGIGRRRRPPRGARAPLAPPPSVDNLGAAGGVGGRADGAVSVVRDARCSTSTKSGVRWWPELIALQAKACQQRRITRVVGPPLAAGAGRTQAPQELAHALRQGRQGYLPLTLPVRKEAEGAEALDVQAVDTPHGGEEVRLLLRRGAGGGGRRPRLRPRAEGVAAEERRGDNTAERVVDALLHGSCRARGRAVRAKEDHLEDKACPKISERPSADCGSSGTMRATCTESNGSKGPVQTPSASKQSLNNVVTFCSPRATDHWTESVRSTLWLGDSLPPPICTGP